MSTHHGLLVHVVFSTKCRYPLIQDPWRDELFAYIGGTVKQHQAVLISAGGIPDHVHLLLKIHPNHAVSATVQMLKANSSRWINDKGKVSARFSWQRGYGAFTVSQSMAETVRRYIANQEAHHRKHSFEDEYLQMLRKHAVEFDERYVFDDPIVT